MPAIRRTTWPASFRFLVAVQGGVLVVAALYFGQPVLMPLIMTVLLTFLLRPGVVWLERHRTPRSAAVGIVALGILLLIGGAAWMITSQFRDLVLHLDEYRGHLHAKITAFHGTRIRSIESLRALIQEVAEAVDSKQQQPGAVAPDGSPPERSANNSARSTSDDTQDPPTPVKVVPASASPWDMVKLIWDSLSTPVTTFIVINVLVLFALAEYEELRNRLYRLAGHNRLFLTMRALDEAGLRISRYLAAYLLVNCGFGILVFLGLSLLGVHYAVLWGFLAATMRFLPYVGVIVGAGLPICMAVIQFPDWTHPGLVVGLFLVLEVLTNSLVEPVTYGKSAGVSAIALLVSALFWAWIWGPMGLLLSVPMTVVLAVLGKHVPQLEPLSILLGDEPALEPHVSFYQRLLAGDMNEAAATLEGVVASHGRVVAYDRLVIPALALAERDGRRGGLDPADFDVLWRNTAALIAQHSPAEPAYSRRTILVVGCAARNTADELVLMMLQQTVAVECEMKVFGARAMASEEITGIAGSGAHAVVISDVGRGSDWHVRYLCKRIHRAVPRVKIIVGRWGYSGPIDHVAAGLRERGADQVLTTLADALDSISRIQPIPLSA
jgi:predicted PurR-regulated permease PerM